MEISNSLFPKSKAQINREKYAAEAAAQASRLEQRKTRARRESSRVPQFGSAEWCETQGDNLGESADY